MASEIRNPKAYWARQNERRRKFDAKVRTAQVHLVAALERHHDGTLVASNWDEVYDLLIINGALGAMVSSRRIAKTLKRHRQQPDIKLSRDSWYRRQYASTVLEAALDELEDKMEVSISISKQRITIRAVTLDESQHSLYAEFAQIAAEAEGEAFVSSHQSRLFTHAPGSTRANLHQWSCGELVA